jgi:hypothetical protein
VPGGRCEACEGDGFQKLEMYFFEDVYVTCPDCEGRRYRPDVLTVALRGRNIADVLALTVDDAADFFVGQPPIGRRLRVLQDVGLGYLRLGQPATTLSGGEAQRLKIAAELGARAATDVLYILDEPTTGLHFDDVKKPRRAQSPVDGATPSSSSKPPGRHHQCADWVVDLTEGGGGTAPDLRRERRRRAQTLIVHRQFLADLRGWAAKAPDPCRGPGPSPPPPGGRAAVYSRPGEGRSRDGRANGRLDEITKDRYRIVGGESPRFAQPGAPRAPWPDAMVNSHVRRRSFHHATSTV